jgi:uncharacterized protein involved in response to NO
MTRATLGHTGRALRANAPTVVLYICVTLGAMLRVTASLGVVPYLALVEIAGIGWSLGLALFLSVYGPMLWKARVE